MAGVVPPWRLCARFRCSPPAPLRCRLPSLRVATVPPGLRSEEQPCEPKAAVPPGLTSDRALWHARVCPPLPLGIPSNTGHWLGLVFAGWPAPEAPLDCGDDGEMLADPGLAARRPFRRCRPPGKGDREPAGTGSEQNQGQQRIRTPAPPGPAAPAGPRPQPGRPAPPRQPSAAV